MNQGIGCQDKKPVTRNARLVLAASIALITTAAQARVATRAPASETKPLPPSQVQASTLPSADSAVTDMWVSHDYPTRNPKAHPGATLTDVEADLIKDFREGTGAFKEFAHVPAKNKGFILRRYELGDKKVTDEVVETSKAGYRLTLGIFDSNPAFKGTFVKGQKHNSDFAHATPRTIRANGEERLAPMAAMIDELEKGGLKLNDLNHGMVMQPLYNGDMAPIMHNKDMIFIVYDNDGSIKEAVLYTGTNNMTDSPRYNRMFRIVDPAAVQYVIANCLEMAKVFSEGGEISDVQSKPPLELTYKDGSTLELAFTDGKFNPNDRIQATLEDAAAHPEQTKINHATFSEYVMTDGGVVEGVRSAMKAQPQMTVSGVLDDQFLDLTQYGKGAALAGFSTTPPHGKSTFGFARDLRSRIDMSAYQRKTDGFVEDDTEGPPVGRHLWHDKTTVLDLELSGVPTDEVDTGSFNLSTNGANAELQMKFRMPKKTSFAPMITESIEKVRAAETPYALPLDVGVFRHFLSQFLGQSIFDIAPEAVKSITAALASGNSSNALRLMREIAQHKSTLNDHAAPQVVEARIAKLETFLAWRAKSQRSIKGIDPQHVTAASVGILNPDAFPGTVLQQMKSALYSSTLSDDKLEDLALSAMKELDLKAPDPKSPPDPLSKKVVVKKRRGDSADAPSDPSSDVAERKPTKGQEMRMAAGAANSCERILTEPEAHLPRLVPEGAHPPFHGGL